MLINNTTPHITSLCRLMEIFTSDAGTLLRLHKIGPLIYLSQCANSVAFALDGVLQGAGEFTFQAWAMLFSAVLASVWFFSGGGGGVGFVGGVDGGEGSLLLVWEALVVFMGGRLATSLFKVKDKDML